MQLGYIIISKQKKLCKLVLLNLIKLLKKNIIVTLLRIVLIIKEFLCLNHFPLRYFYFYFL